MSPPKSTAEPRTFSPRIVTVLGSWLLVGTLDITGASLNFWAHGGRNLGLLFRYIARALMGPSAATSPVAPLLGGVLHYCVALLFTVFFFYVLARPAGVRARPILAGACYGGFMWAVMAFVVLPATAIGRSQIPQTLPQMRQSAIAIGILIVAIGWPLAFLARCTARREA